MELGRFGLVRRLPSLELIMSRKNICRSDCGRSGVGRRRCCALRAGSRTGRPHELNGFGKIGFRLDPAVAKLVCRRNIANGHCLGPQTRGRSHDPFIEDRPSPWRSLRIASYSRSHSNYQMDFTAALTRWLRSPTPIRCNRARRRPGPVRGPYSLHRSP
jgi:hypothetical protein